MSPPSCISGRPPLHDAPNVVSDNGHAPVYPPPLCITGPPPSHDTPPTRQQRQLPRYCPSLLTYGADPNATDEVGEG